MPDARGSGDRPRHADPRLGSRATLRLFVYGTLQSGQPAHRRFCSRLIGIEPATVRGRLHLHPDGYPVLDVADAEVIAVGSDDPLADAESQRRAAGLATSPASTPKRHEPGREAPASRSPAALGPPRCESLAGSRFVPASDLPQAARSLARGLVHGELLTLADPLATLPPIDRFEEFSATAPSLYRRVLLWVEASVRTPAWTYVRGPALLAAELDGLPGGRWPPARD